MASGERSQETDAEPFQPSREHTGSRHRAERGIPPCFHAGIVGEYGSLNGGWYSMVSGTRTSAFEQLPEIRDLRVRTLSHAEVSFPHAECITPPQVHSSHCPGTGQLPGWGALRPQRSGDASPVTEKVCTQYIPADVRTIVDRTNSERALARPSRRDALGTLDTPQDWDGAGRLLTAVRPSGVAFLPQHGYWSGRAELSRRPARASENGFGTVR